MNRSVGKIIFKGTLIWLILWNSLPVSLSIFCKSSPEGRGLLDYSYGYRVGDYFHFTDNTTETLSTPRECLVEQEVHTIGVLIEIIDEDIEYYSIRILAHITNLSAGIDDYNSMCYMEGYSPIVAGPHVYFTHTDWNAHYSDWLSAASEFKHDNQLSGLVTQDLQAHYFQWNLTKYVDNSTSSYDLDLDGENDAYDIIYAYTAQFDGDGVIILRSFYNEMMFECGARYVRLRAINLEGEFTNSLLIIDPYLITIIIIISTVTFLIAMVFFLIIHYPKGRKRDVAT